MQTIAGKLVAIIAVLVWPLAQSGDRRDVHLILAAKIRVSPVFSQVSPEFPDPQMP
jgi:hypothetical protein